MATRPPTPPKTQPEAGEPTYLTVTRRPKMEEKSHAQFASNTITIDNHTPLVALLDGCRNMDITFENAWRCQCFFQYGYGVYNLTILAPNTVARGFENLNFRDLMQILMFCRQATEQSALWTWKQIEAVKDKAYSYERPEPMRAPGGNWGQTDEKAREKARAELDPKSPHVYTGPVDNSDQGY